MNRNPNPQGKGLVPVLQGLQQHWARVRVPAKHIDQVSLELFTSLFVLQSEFKFNPVAGQDYWLYRRGKAWMLSLISPDEWGQNRPGRYIGRCELQQDRTWTLDLDPDIAADGAFMSEVEQRRRQLQEKIETAAALQDILPDYDDRAGYYSKVLAFILGKSLRSSMQLAGIAALDYKAAKGLITAPAESSNAPP
jgi:hypothetical protein